MPFILLKRGILDIKIEKIVYPPLQVNTYIVFDKEGNSVIIDPGGDFKPIRKILEKNNIKIKAILITHSHFDHVLGVSYIENIVSIPLYVPLGDKSLYYSARDFTKNFLGFDPGEFKEPDFWLKGGENLNFGSLEVDVYSTPGHTPGHVIYVINRKIFTGDLIFSGSIGRTDFPESSFEDMKKSILYVINNFSDDFEVYPGHGPKTTIGIEKRQNYYIIQIQKQVSI
ncbi:MAG: MBL fold metallo-hydrolase [Candidatus Hydrothermales bacterium]